MKRKVLSLALVGAIALSNVYVVNIHAEEENDDITKITLLSTSDLHGRIYPWEYAIDTPQEVGLAKVATIIKEQREIDPDLILVDTGDTIESNMVDLFKDDDIHPMVKGLNMLEYDTWSLGNHEFNFGLDVLNNAIDDFEGTVISSNIVNEEDDSFFVQPYEIVTTKGVDIAIVGMLPPYVKRWEASTPEHFEGLDFIDTVEGAQRAVDMILETEDVDLIIGAFHLGLDGEGYVDGLHDNTTDIVNQVEGLDAVFMGHAHAAIGFADDQVYVKDTVVTEPGFAGKYVSKLEFELVEVSEGEYEILDKRTDLLPVTGVEPDQEILDAFEYVDERSKEAAYEVIGTATDDFLPENEFKGLPVAQVQDTAVIDLINEVQMFYAGADVSGAALFDTRSDIKKGEIQFKDAALIYKYSNTLQGHKVNGKQLKDYMEWSASFYNTINDGDVTVSFNPEIRGYNYDMFAGVDYKIDLTKEPGERIVDLTFNGEPVTDDLELVLAVNNYRVGTLQGLGILPEDGSSVVFDSTNTPTPEMQRLIAKYIREEKDGVVSPDVDYNWELMNAPEMSEDRNNAMFLVNNEYITLPKSEDGRTSNVKSINIYEELPEMSEIELLNNEMLDSDVKDMLEANIESGLITNYGVLYDMAVAGITKETKPEPKPEVEVDTTTDMNDTTPVENTEVDMTTTNMDYMEYIVMSGDTLYDIAMENNVSWMMLAEENDLANPHMIFPGQVIKIFK